MEISKKNELELQILLALFNATMEQTDYFNGEFKFRIKQIFKKWQKQGIKMQNVIEVNSDTELLNQITDVIHDAIKEIKSKLTEN